MIWNADEGIFPTMEIINKLRLSFQRLVHGTSKFVDPVIPVAASTMADNKNYNHNNSADKLQANTASQPQFVPDFSHHPQYLQDLFACKWAQILALYRIEYHNFVLKY